MHAIYQITSLLDIENTVFTPSPSQQIMFDILNNLITQNSYCNEDDNDEEVKSTNCYCYSTEEFTKPKFKLFLYFT